MEEFLEENKSRRDLITYVEVDMYDGHITKHQLFNISDQSANASDKVATSTYKYIETQIKVTAID